MSDNAAIEMLEEEHKLIVQVVLGLHGLSRHLREGRAIETGLLREAVEFMRDFVGRCHHAKEEDILFPALAAHGVPLHGCPLDALLHEHHQGRSLTGKLNDAIDELEAGADGAAASIAAHIAAIERLYPEHIWKEDEMVFPMAERLIPRDIRNQLTIQLEELDAENPPGTRERFRDFANRLSAAAIA